MGLLKLFGLNSNNAPASATRSKALRPVLELLESRELLAADGLAPEVLLGGVYFEEATGDDSQPDILQISFVGGPAGATLDRLVIDTDKDGLGLSAGDLVFDTAPGGGGTDGFASTPLEVVSSEGFTVVGMSVTDGGTQIVFDLSGFEAGETLVFSVDVDEYQGDDPETSLPFYNSLVEGAEFQFSHLTGSFSAPGYVDLDLTGTYYDFFNGRRNTAETEVELTLDLPDDRYTDDHDFTDRTAGAVAHAPMLELATLSGFVYHDLNDDGVFDPGEAPIEGVELKLLDAAGADTGLRAVTNADGFYKFVDLAPGKYTVMEVQPEGWVDGRDTPGSHGGAAADESAGPVDMISSVMLAYGDHATEYNFGEIKLSSIGGIVMASHGPGCDFDNPDELLEGVKIELLNEAGAVIAVTHTDAQGRYRFDGLRPGKYSVREYTPSGYFDGEERAGTVGGDVADDLISNITLLSAQDATNYDFCEHVGPTLAGYVYHDASHDGQFDAAEDPIAGVELRLIDGQGNDTGLRATTNVDGYYQFTDLAPGKYTVMETQPAGWLDGKDTIGSHGGAVSNDMLRDAVLQFGDNAVNYNFGELLAASIAGRVSAFTGPDCDPDHPEILVEGVQIDLLDAAGNVVATTHTDAEGRYSFTGLRPGEYQVKEHQPSEYFDGDEHVGSAGGAATDDLISSIALGSGEDATRYDFCEHVGATLSGYVYHDRSDDGSYDRGSEESIAGVTLKLFKDGADTGRTAITDANGYYQFSDLDVGGYTVVQAHPAGWLDGQDTPGSHGGAADSPGDAIREIVLTYGDDSIENNFGELLAASIAGRVHASTGPDCDFDNPEILLEGVQIDLLDADGALVATTHTGADGRYSFTGLRPGDYQVKEHQPVGYYDGDEHVGSEGGVATDDLVSGVYLGSGVDATRYDFCEHVGATLSGYVYHDRSDDGSYDRPTEDPIAGVTLKLIAADGSDTGLRATTDANGYYEFTNLAPGTYAVVEVHPAGWLDGQDTPGSHGGVADAAGDTISQITITYGDQSIENNFGELLAASIAGRVSAFTGPDCDPDHPEILVEGVQIDLLDAAGNVVATTHTDAEGRYSFTGLRPGEYQVKEHQPTEYFDGDEHVGTAGGAATDDLISSVALGSGEDATRYDFCEHVGATLSGYVYHDRSDDGSYDRPTEEPIAGVTLKLYRDGVDTGRTSITDADGYYRFSDLDAGSYTVVQAHPAGWLDGQDTPGSHGGTADAPGDAIRQITLTFGDDSVENNFGELLPGSIRGKVVVSTDPECDPDDGEPPIEGVKIELLNEAGEVIAVTHTDANGEYAFTNLPPGVYSVREVQPAGYFNADQHIGDGGGAYFGQDLIGDVHVGSDQHWDNYDFCETPPASLSGYVFIDGAPIVTLEDIAPEDIVNYRDGVRSADDAPLAGVTVELRNGVSGDPIFGDQALPGYYPDGPIRAVTDANGFYRFDGLPGGVYAVVQIQPDNLIDGVDTVGTLGGIAINPVPPVDREVIAFNEIPTPGRLTIEQFRTNFGDNAIVRIPLQAGQHSAENNFSEVRTTSFYAPPITPPETPPPALIIAPPMYLPPRLASQFLNTPGPSLPFYGASEALGWTWHLSVVNAGRPRAAAAHGPTMLLAKNQFDAAAWESGKLDEAEWTLVQDEQDDQQRFRFGEADGIPVVGDWNGDGVDEIGVFTEGYWRLDLNGNGVWDRGDLWAKLGTRSDLPVTGDWDGDGKTDIGIYGPAWPRDPHAIAREPGLPDADNYPAAIAGKAKNVPPTAEDATSGGRLLRRTASGASRADLIDHVFHYGAPGDQPIAGDWNGDGIRSIGVYRDGVWVLDINGDGRFTESDQSFTFGAMGDLPVVGDWNGDGVDDLGVYRAGRWLVDSNSNRELDAKDTAFELGAPGDTPIAGDWDGDGADEPAVYGPKEATVRVSQKAG